MRLHEGQWKLIVSVFWIVRIHFPALLIWAQCASYKRLAMLAYIMQNVFIDPKWAADEYLRRCKASKWKKGAAEDALKCFNLERIIDAKVFGLNMPDELTLDDYMGVVVEVEE